MKYFTLLLATLFCRLMFANNYTDYTNHIATDRFILIFEKNISNQQKAKIIEASGIVYSYTHLPAPALTICFTNNFNQAQQYFNKAAGVRFFSFFITDGSNHYAGVLNDFFVKLADKNFEPLFRSKLKAMGLNEPVADSYIPNLYRVKDLKLTDGKTIDICTTLLHENWVTYAVPNYLLNPLVTSNDPYYNREWNIHNDGSAMQGSGTPGADMHVDTAWGITTGDPSIKIAVIDAGVDTLHPDLSPNLLPGHDAIDDSFSTNGYPTPNYPEDGHGTCCAGIIAAVKDNNIGVAGVAPSCKIIPVHVFYYINLQGNVLPYSTAAAFADAIGWSWDTAQADIMSHSWGLPPSLIGFLPGGTQPVNDAIQQAALHGRNGKGIAMFFSSGNDNDSTSPIWPSSLQWTIAVNATNMCDTRKYPGDCSGASESWGGDYGPGLDFGAPGVKISTTDMLGAKGFSGGDYYPSFNGTSAACPNAAAVGALILSVRPDLTAEDVRNIIAQTCDKVGDYHYDSVYANGTWCKELGYGRVNAYRALLLASTYSAVNDMQASIELNVFPNPANGTLNISYTGNKQLQLQMLDMAGRLLWEQETETGLTNRDISALPSGMYLLKAISGQNIATRKVAIIR